MTPQLQATADSIAARHLADTVSIRRDTLGAPPLPGGISPVVRAMFDAPTWLWVLIIAVCAAVAAGLAWTAWKHRVAIVAWLRTRPRRVTIAIFATVGFLVLASAGFGAASWHFMQHDNRFCVSCHVMTPAFQAMRTSTIHDTLQCHQCHQQSMFASAFQLYVWLKDRPEKIEKHAVVPNSTCKGCHNSQKDAKWTRVLRTAGHRVHLESDTSALANVECTTCHGQEIHRFLPADHTCGQQGCHRPEDTHIRIGPMAAQTTLHCVTCHQFTAELPQLASLDSARGTLRPGRGQCFSCHAMQQRLASFNLAKDPHRGQCGMCHNPHTQTHPVEALKNCTTAACHGVEVKDIPFHAGSIHRAAVQNCLTCHNPHAARLDASDCQGCHADVARRIPRLRRLLQPFDTTRAARRAMLPDSGGRTRISAASGSRESPRAPPGASPGKAATLEKTSVPKHAPPALPTDTVFAHSKHASLQCLTCHDPHSSSKLTFVPPRGCQICHHQSPEEMRCPTCHTPDLAAPRPRVVTVTVRGRPPRPRTVDFPHAKHSTLRCTACHTEPVTMAIGDSVGTCTACHDDHHHGGRTCSICHNDTTAFAPHAPPARAHAGCNDCHDQRTVAGLVPDRSLCLTCHGAKSEHQPGRECTTCHFLADPDTYRRHLTSRAG